MNSDLTDKSLSLFGKSGGGGGGSSGRGAMVADDQKSLHSLSSSSPSQSSESPSPMSSNFSSPTNDDFKSKKASITSTSEVIKCTYLNEINKDELPKPNFVSSVKNLFEKQITNQFAFNSMIEPRQSHANKPRHRQRQSLVETVSSSSSLSINKTNSPVHFCSSAKSNAGLSNSIGGSSKPPLKKSISIESLVDRLKQNGTLVYEHSEKENGELIISFKTLICKKKFLILKLTQKKLIFYNLF